MASELSPFVEANYGWPYGSSGWNTEMNQNLVKFSYLHDRNIDAIVSSLPAIADGTAYFNTADNRLYFDAEGVRYSSPTPKWFEVTLRASGEVYQFDGSALGLKPADPADTAYTDVLRSDLVDPDNEVVGWERSPLSGAADKVSRMLDSQTVNIWEKQFTDLVTNFSNYNTLPYTCDWAPALMAAFATGKRVYAPSVDPTKPYVLLSKVVLPKTTCQLVGDGDSSLFIFDAVLDHGIERIDDATPESLSPVIFENFKLDCNRKVGWGLWTESSKKGTVYKVNIERFLIGGMRGGSPTGVGARYYENQIFKPGFDAGVVFSVTAVGMAAFGLVLELSATDNVVYNPVCAYITDIGVHVKGGSNKIYTPHAYGNNASDTGPQYCVVMEGVGELMHPHCDNPTVAGVAIRSRGVQLTGGSYQWAADNIPSVGGATCIEVADALNEIVILGGSSRSANASNPTIKYLGTKPDRSTVMGFSPFTPNAGETNVNYVTQQLGIIPRPGARSQFSIDTPTGSDGALRLLKNSNLRYEITVTSSAETGSNAGSNLSATYTNDAGTPTTWLNHFRAFNLTELIGQVKLGTTNVGFYGANPVAKPTVTGSLGGNAALTSLVTALASQGLIINSTTA